MANESGGIGNLDYLGDPRGENKQFFPDKNIGPTYKEAVKFLTKERSDGLSFNESAAKSLVIALGVGPILKLSELTQRGASGTAQAFKDMGSFIQDPSGATINGVKFLINAAVKGWNKVNPVNKIDIKVDAKGNFFPKGDTNSPGSSDIETINQEVLEAGVDGLLSPTDRDVLDTLSPEDRAQYIKDIKSGKRVDVPFDKNQKTPGQFSDTNQAGGEKEKVGGLKGIANFLVPGTRFDPFKGGSSESSQTSKGIGDLLTGIGLDGNQTVVNPDGSTATRAEVQAAITKGQDRGKLTKVGIAAGEELLNRFDKDGDGKYSADENEAYYDALDKEAAMDLGPNSAPGTGGIFPNMGANRQDFGGGNYGPSSGFDNMSNYFWPMALNDAAKRGEDVSSSEGIKSVFDQTFPGGDYNKFKYSSGPGALAFFGVDSLGFDGKPKKSKGKSRILNSEGKEVDNIEWYEYDPITGEGLFTEAGLEKFKAANPGVTPPVGVKRSSASRKDGEPNLSEPGENEKDDGLNPDGSRKLPPIPRPDKDGKCPAGYTGIDTNGDGFIDTCVAEQSQIPGAPDTQNAGLGGRVRVGGEKDTLEQASEKSSKQVFNDPTNFMRFAPSALQMMDPRYYGIKSFVPRGEEKDFNTQYRSIPGQQYANYNVVKDREKPFFAEGGLSSLHPRMNGQISGPGTEKSDDIPAMLSDGEFVVNAAAVRGIGNLMGRKKPKSKVDQRREGARTMYALQKAGEQASRMS